MKFYNMSLKEVRALTNEDNEMLWQAIDKLEAQSMLLELQVAAFPHMEAKEQKKLSKKLNEMAFLKEERKGKTLSADELEAALNGVR